MEDDKPNSASLTKVTSLPKGRQRSLSEETGKSGVIHRVENVTASIKFTGHIVSGLSDSEQEFISSEEEVDYTLKEINTTNIEPKELVFSEDIEKLSKKLERSTFKDIDRSESSRKERASPSSADLVETERKRTTSQETAQNKFKEIRFNPFDRDLHMEEDHFENDHLSDVDVIRSHSASNASSSWTNATDGDDVTFADLGLAEDHFSLPDGHFGLSSSEEIEMAIENCKEMIRYTPPNTDKAKNLVQKLVQLRLRLQDLKEGPEPVAKDVKVVVGHKFQLQVTRSTKHYCEKCNAMILGVIQSWYKCSDCGYCCHEKCLNLITRTCASLKVQENPTFCLSICPNRGLSSQNYRCAECRSSISFKTGFSEPRLCDYSGNYYCELCHWNDAMIIPARVLHNWDFDTRKDINPMLFNYVEELNEVKKLREELLIMKKYLLICADAMDSKYLLLLRNRQHFVESSDKYSMRDLLDVQSDTLLSELIQVHSTWAQHIKTDCQLCNEQEILFPFDNIAVVCSQCSCVLHRHCFAKRGAECPRLNEIMEIKRK
ncbi:hypothetical protein KUTeg_023514, partial [Tegillarca granosa]